MNYAINSEQDHYVDIINGEGYSYDVAINDVGGLCELVSLDDVIYEDGQHYSYEENLPYLQRLLNGDNGDFEITEINVLDALGGAYGHTAATLELKTKDANNSTASSLFYTSSEYTAQLWKDFFDVGQ